jgi:hypothetical protein
MYGVKNPVEVREHVHDTGLTRRLELSCLVAVADITSDFSFTNTLRPKFFHVQFVANTFPIPPLPRGLSGHIVRAPSSETVDVIRLRAAKPKIAM